MVKWLRNKLTIYKLSIEVNELSAMGAYATQPLDGEGDQEYLLRLIQSDPYKK